ncbi:MAG: hypothetical protein ACK4GL_05435 [Flavobacteriales bacterium]
MKTTSGKLLWFIIGLLLGLCVSFAMFLTFSPGVRQNPIINKFISRDTIIDKRLSDTSGEKSDVKIRKKTSETNISYNVSEEPDENILPAVKDTFKNTSLTDGSAVVVKKDELIQIVDIRIKELDAIQPKKAADSLLDHFEKGNQTGEKQIFSVEFWRSPVNYIGYRMIRNKIVTFGLDVNDMVELLRYDGKIFLKQNNNIFMLKQTTEFDSFKPVNDELKTRILAKING